MEENMSNFKGQLELGSLIGIFIIIILGSIFAVSVADQIFLAQNFGRSPSIVLLEDVWANITTQAGGYNVSEVKIKFDTSDILNGTTVNVTTAVLCISNASAIHNTGVLITVIDNATWTEGEIDEIEYATHTNGTSWNRTLVPTGSRACVEIYPALQENVETGKDNFTFTIEDSSQPNSGATPVSLNNSAILRFGNETYDVGTAANVTRFDSSEGTTAPTLTVSYTYGLGVTSTLIGLLPMFFILGLLLFVAVWAKIKS
jgi:hypothetical protein